jgi:nitrate reductase assembly molybdenum cofactor insertion protein NarJ
MSKLSTDSRALIAEAAEWRLLALLFEYPGEEWRRQLDALASEVRQEELRRAAEGSQQQACEGLHIALFGPGGPVSLREATYQGGVQLGYLMSELSAIYDAFGYQPRTEEALDHLSVETGFLSYLKLKQAYAQECGHAEHAAVVSDAAANFVKEHLAMVAEPIALKLANLAPEHLVLAGRFLVERIGKRPHTSYPLGGELIDVEEDDMSCGASSETSDNLVQLES